MSIWKSLFGHSSPPRPSVTTADADPATVAAMNHQSTKLYRGETPDFCFIGAPFGGMANMPSDLTGSWAQENQALAAASALSLSDEQSLEKLLTRLNAKTKTVIIPDITVSEVLGNHNAVGSLKHRALFHIRGHFGLSASDCECFPMVSERDSTERYGPVGFLFVFRRD